MENLTIIRKESHATQQEVADYLGISRQAYGNYESGKREPDYETLLKLVNTSIAASTIFLEAAVVFVIPFSRSLSVAYWSNIEARHLPFRAQFANFLISMVRLDRIHEVPLSIQGNLRVLHSVAYISSVARGAAIFSKVNSPFYSTILR